MVWAMRALNRRLSWMVATSSNWTAKFSVFMRNPLWTIGHGVKVVSFVLFVKFVTCGQPHQPDGQWKSLVLSIAITPPLLRGNHIVSKRGDQPQLD